MGLVREKSEGMRVGEGSVQGLRVVFVMGRAERRREMAQGKF